MSNTSNNTTNFRVVVRVRPPLTRELPPKGEKDDDGLKVKFSPITDISEDGRVLTLCEYLGKELTEKGRQRDIERNPQYIARHQFGFDRIF